MSDEKNKCITDIAIKKKLEKIKAFKQRVVGIKPEELKNDATPVLYTGEKAKEKMDSIYLPNCVENSAKKHRLKLVTRNELFIYLDEPKKKNGKLLQPILEESKSGKRMKSHRLNDIRTNKTVHIKSIKIMAKDEKLFKNISKKSIIENKEVSKEEEMKKDKEN